MIKRLIFDVDNTLITGASFTKAKAETLKYFDLYSEKNMQGFDKAIFTYESVYNSYNKKDYAEHLGKCINSIIPEGFYEVFFDRLQYVISDEYEEVARKIEELSKNYELVLLTNFFSQSQLNRLNNMGIGKYFTEVHGEDLIKPNEYAFIKACGPHKPEECVMIGDSIDIDVEGAKKAGLNAIFVNTKKIDTSNLDVATVDKVEDITEEVLNKLI